MSKKNSVRPGKTRLHRTIRGIASKIGSTGSHSQEIPNDSENSVLKSSVPTGQKRVDPLLGYDWAEEYRILCERFADKRVAAYVAWAASPIVRRKPGKLLDLAKALGLRTDRTIRQWREKDPTIDEVVKELQAAPLREYRRDIFQALVASALVEGSGGHADRRLALEMLGDYQPKLKQETLTDARPFTSDELAEAAKEVQRWQAQMKEKKAGDALSG